MQPNSTTAHYNKKQVLYHLQRYEDALQAYQEAIRCNPNDARAHHQQGVILYILNRYQEALQAYVKAIRLNPQYTTAYHSERRRRAPIFEAWEHFRWSLLSLCIANTALYQL